MSASSLVPKPLQNPQRSVPGYAARDLLTVLFREKRLILTLFTLVFLVGLLVSFKLGIVYKAEARVLVLPSREYTLRPETGEAGLNLAMGENQIVRSETEILKNLQIIEKTIETVGISKLYPEWGDSESASGQTGIYGKIRSWFGLGPDQTALENARRAQLDQALASFTRQLEVLPVKDSNVISLLFSHKDATLAEDVLNILLATYLDFRRTIFYQPRSKFFKEQKDHLTQRLTKVEQTIADFKRQNDISAFADQKSLLVRQKTELYNNKLDTDNRLLEAEGRLTVLQKQLTSAPREIPLYSENSHQDSRDTARATLLTLEARRNELLTRFSEKNQYVIDLDDQIAKLRGILSNTPPKKSENQRTGRNPLFDELASESAKRTTEVAAMKARQGSLREQLESATQRLQQFDHLEQEYNALTMEKNLLEKNLQSYSQKLEESEIQEELDRQTAANVRVIQNAQSPREGRNLSRIALLLGLFGGLFMALAAAFIKDAFRQVLISPEDAERATGLPVLLAIPLKA
ncbi:polysaccharide biosynthesis protein PslE [Gammaproteobacteria bacterium]